MRREEWTLREKVEVLEKRVSTLERILRISQILISTLQLEPLLQTITQSAIELTDTEASSIMLVDENTGELRFEAVSGPKREEVKPITVPLEGSIAGWILREGKPLTIPDVRQDPRFYSQVDETTDFETRSILGVPLQVKGKVIGVLEALNKTGDGTFIQDDVQTLSTLAAHAAIAVASQFDAWQLADQPVDALDSLQVTHVVLRHRPIPAHDLRKQGQLADAQ